jgi:hypothetical protein
MEPVMRQSAWISPLLVASLVACAQRGEDAGDTDTAVGGVPAQSATALACAPTASGAELTGRASPYDSVSVAVGGGSAKICYSRPTLRGRTMIGGEAVPYGRLWRFGANEPTIIHLDVPASIAGVDVRPGSYSLYAVPMEGEEWTLVVNPSTSQWGHEGQYTPDVEAQELGRVPVRAETLAQPVESFTIRPDPGGAGVVAEWQNTRLHIPITAAT